MARGRTRWRDRLQARFDVRVRTRARQARETADGLTGLLIPDGHLSELLKNPRLQGPGGFYETISILPAYTGAAFDKKARVLAHDLHREGIVTFCDPENLKPVVEYHLIRLYLRSGRVVPASDSVREELLGNSRPARPRLVKLLRGAVDLATGIERLRRNELARFARLRTLAPDIVSAIVEGRQPASLSARKLLRTTYLPVDWSEQRIALGFA
jgi:hypothetical protein